MKNMKAARQNKEKDKQFALSGQDHKFISPCFDMQEILMTPKGFESVLYYKRRLNSSTLVCMTWEHRKHHVIYGMKLFQEEVHQ